MRLTLFFDGQFWVAVFERHEENRLRAFRHVFGAEPQLEDVEQYVLKRAMAAFDQVGSSIEAPTETLGNPKRRQREAARLLQKHEPSTFAQRALALEREQRKEENCARRRKHREETARIKREKAVQKAKEKHRGH